MATKSILKIINIQENEGAQELVRALECIEHNNDTSVEVSCECIEIRGEETTNFLKSCTGAT